MTSYHYMGTTSSGELMVKGIDGERERWWKYRPSWDQWFSRDVSKPWESTMNIPAEVRSAIAAWIGQAKREAATMNGIHGEDIAEMSNDQG